MQVNTSTNPTVTNPTVTKQELYDIKRIEFLGKKVPILLQTQNGPCPLLAIANQLLLWNRIVLPEEQEFMSLENLVHIVAERLIDSNQIDESSEDVENKRKALSDAIEILPTLATGLDINIKFSGVDAFEFDKSIGVFDMLGITIYHGWVIDVLDETFSPLRSVAYNTLVERVVNFDSKFGHDENAMASSIEDPELRKIAADGELAQRFLNTYASQLTFTGLAQLHETIKEREVCVFFRNNHFCTMFKIQGELYLLCTDSGYKNRSAVAWERLNDINGDTELCSPTFGDPNAYLSADDAFQEMSTDAAIAEQLQLEEQVKMSNNNVLVNNGDKSGGTFGNQMSQDEALARSLADQDRRELGARRAQEKEQKPRLCCIC